LRSRKETGTQYGYISKKSLPVTIKSEPLQRPQISVGEMFGTLLEAKVHVEQWRREYNHIRSHSSLGYRPTDPEVIIPVGA
jgi:transposase InsO family protein